LSKGMSLEQLKEQLEGNAQKRCAEQEKTIKNLIEQNKRMVDLIKDKETEIRQLQNRCYAISRGVLCVFCNIKHKCNAKKC
jgi:DNA-binding transcriptional MerR regulator